ncbi:GAF domain-containing protein [Kutzneria sp. 744]|uniref:GAF domain-containing protein n=1 Tax=Kutzneria sp. (strain 744) TaxID=345341 RepID=UPI0003EEC85D|nr:GAF domain-containing protein [Kutzneria sp. 744]EWM12114.1 hypothetical protein KUTG_02418 [Kutzneria sp. 744]
MTVPVLFHRPCDGVDSSTGVRAHRIRTTELPADEFILPDLLRALAASCCHLTRADFCVLTVTSPPALAFDTSHIGDTHRIPRQADAAVIDAAPTGRGASPTAARRPTAPPETTGMCLFVEVPIRAGAAVIGRVGLAAQHDHTGFTDQDRDTATTIAAIAGDAVRLVAVIREPRHHDQPGDVADDLADAIINALYGVGVQLHVRAPADAMTSVRHTVGTLSRAVRQLQLVMLGSDADGVVIEKP